LSVKTKILSMLTAILLTVSIAGTVTLHVIAAANQDAEFINFLGRQRMLSQLMGKSVLGYAMEKHILDDIRENIVELDNHITSLRKVYTQNVTSLAMELGANLSMQPEQEPHPAIPFPATFTRMINEDYASVSGTDINIIAENPINSRRGFISKADHDAKAYLSENPQGVFFAHQEQLSGLLLSFYTADRATVPECVTCHSETKNTSYQMGDLLGLRRYDMHFTGNAGVVRRALSPSLEVYYNSEKAFSQTLNAVKNGGTYPLDLDMTKYGEIPAINEPAMRETIFGIEAILNKFRSSVDTIAIGKFVGLDGHKALQSVVTNSNELLMRSDRLVSQFTAYANKKQNSIRYAVLSMILVVFLVVTGIYLFFVARIINPLGQMTNFMMRLASGATGDDVPLREQTDEIGNMAKAVDVFRLNAIERRKAEKALQEAHDNMELQVAERTSELAAATSVANKANMAKSEFLASMSHELRTPLNAVLGFAQLMQYNASEPLSPAQREHVDHIITGGNHLLDLVDEILDLARIEADQFTFSVNEIDINKIIANCVSLTANLGRQRNISIVDNLSGAETPLIRTDEQRFTQILLNLLSNAVKYNRDGGTVTIDGYDTENGFLRIEVADTGFGIAEQDRDSVFQIFHRLGSDPTKAREGTGIGLTVSKLLVERMAGRIGFESEVDIGTTFWVEFPLASNEEVLIWTEAFRIGIEPLDKDHQTLVSLLNRVSQTSIDTGDITLVLEELTDYTLYHFEREEAVMEACGYSALGEHRKLHEDLEKRLGTIVDEWRRSPDPKQLSRIRKFMRGWLFDHIINVDAGIARFASGKNREIQQAMERLENGAGTTPLPETRNKAGRDHIGGLGAPDLGLDKSF